MTEDLAIERGKAGDAEAMEWLMRRYAGLIYTLAQRWRHRVSDVEDGFQEGYIALYQSVRTYENGRGTTFLTWFYLKLREQLLGNWRKEMGRYSRKEYESLDEYAPGGSQKPYGLRLRKVDVLEDKSPPPSVEDRIAIAKWWDKLSDREQHAIHLYASEHKTFKQIGKEWGVSEARAYQIIQVAREKGRFVDPTWNAKRIKKAA